MQSRSIEVTGWKIPRRKSRITMLTLERLGRQIGAKIHVMQLPKRQGIALYTLNLAAQANLAIALRRFEATGITLTISIPIHQKSH